MHITRSHQLDPKLIKRGATRNGIKHGALRHCIIHIVVRYLHIERRVDKLDAFLVEQLDLVRFRVQFEVRLQRFVDMWRDLNRFAVRRHMQCVVVEVHDNQLLFRITVKIRSESRRMHAHEHRDGRVQDTEHRVRQHRHIRKLPLERLHKRGEAFANLGNQTDMRRRKQNLILLCHQKLEQSQHIAQMQTAKDFFNITIE
mmetsp:Transcript_15494/g.23642  ORF Transcript_15494/g.23642 Transcript_15494/m.23642 type:complete len:200 (+) Transcript_15494:804-1403(+)